MALVVHNVDKFNNLLILCCEEIFYFDNGPVFLAHTEPYPLKHKLYYDVK